mgnify:CR=1 FL=1
MLDSSKYRYCDITDGVFGQCFLLNDSAEQVPPSSQVHDHVGLPVHVDLAEPYDTIVAINLSEQQYFSASSLAFRWCQCFKVNDFNASPQSSRPVDAFPYLRLCATENLQT